MDVHPGARTAQRFFTGTGPSYDLIVNLCTLGFDFRWKENILRRIPPNATAIVDQACGTGILTFKIARRFPDCRITGVELRDEYLNIAKAKAEAIKLKNVEFALGRAEEVRVDAPIDCITSSYLAKYAELGSLVRNARAMLRPGGVLVVHDFAYPPGHVFAQLWELYLRLLQTVGPRAFPEWKTVFDELPEFLRQTVWVAELRQALEEQGFTAIHVESLTWGAAAVITATSPGA
jgi:demethylmenaquinone methyltransferase/2-methoxy-6-polyprenyl-1,4-benzoquinol methylase